ncbi:hypothetical protein NPIL_453891 [Nephila pilipes]|uniref:Transmembrane protein n=1 Tax=Nephila pilipes TaxID=299642 RepID=A0A8X6PNE9_NEPPI|nr:hypothetical protein NPIL_453891 [Nephila pilipes]
MVSPVSLESRLSRPLEPLRSDLRFGSLLMILAPWIFFFVFLALSSASAFRSAGLPDFVCCVLSSCAVFPVLKTSTRLLFIYCVLWTPFKTFDRFPPGTFVPKTFI